MYTVGVTIFHGWRQERTLDTKPQVGRLLEWRDFSGSTRRFSLEVTPFGYFSGQGDS